MAARRSKKPLSVRISRGRLTMSAAMRITAASLANSLGCRPWPPTTIQRRAPLIVVPMPGTSTAMSAEQHDAGERHGAAAPPGVVDAREDPHGAHADQHPDRPGARRSRSSVPCWKYASAAEALYAHDQSVDEQEQNVTRRRGAALGDAGPRESRGARRALPVRRAAARVGSRGGGPGGGTPLWRRCARRVVPGRRSRAASPAAPPPERGRRADRRVRDARGASSTQSRWSSSTFGPAARRPHAASAPRFASRSPA